MQRKVLVTVIKCLFLIQPIFGQHCSIVITADNCNISVQNQKDVNVKVFTVATNENDGYKRYNYSAKHYGINIHNLGLELTTGSETKLYSAGSYKVKLLKEALEPLRNDQNTIIIFTDSTNTVFAAGFDQIIKKFMNTEAKILFGTQSSCQAQHRLKKLYPDFDTIEDKLLNSVMFMGFASDVYKVLVENPIRDTDDDQVYYTNLYVNEKLREKYSIQLDTESEIFQNLNGELDEVKLNVNPETLEGVLENTYYLTTPCIIHGDGSSRIYLNSFANYLGGTFKNKKCLICEENLVSYTENNFPTISMTIFIEKAVPFFEEFLQGIKSINYPKDRINLFIHNNVPYHDNEVEEFVKNHQENYESIEYLTTSNKLDEVDARKLSIDRTQQKGSDFLFSIDADVHIDEPNILLDLLQYNKTFIAPVITLRNYNYSNFWGDLSKTGFYARSHDYLNIINGKIRGMWNVPYISMCYLVHKSAFQKMNFDHMKFDPDMALCESLRNEGIFMNVINTKHYGHLIDSDEFDTTLTRPDFYMLIANQYNWEKRYIHPNYHDQLKPNFTHKQPCPDVYWFPVTTKRFCKDLVAIMETFGKWSDGSNSDPRLDGGYEAVPTRDIHMTQVGLQDMWLRFLKVYVKPLKDAVYDDSDTSAPNSQMNFVVRYRPDEQPSLMPHHDTSTYTINIALNRVGVDYEGGGCRFLRYNCSVTDTKRGWMLMHPGRLTHLHEGLTVTNGTRYIMVSFVDP